MKYFLIMNPGSRGGSSRKRFQQIFALLRAARVDFDFRVTRSLDDAYNLSVEANEAGYEVIVAVGGDGTLNRVMNGFYDASGRRRSRAKLGVIYTGTSPDFCKSYGIPTRLADAVQVLLRGDSRVIQIGMITFANEWRDEYADRPVPSSSRFSCEVSGRGCRAQGNRGGEITTDGFVTRYFACCANIGLGAALARNANGGIRKWFGDHIGTFFALLKTLATYRANNFSIFRDGVEEELENVHTISVGKTLYIASGIKVRNNLQHGDNRMYNLIIQNMRLQNLPRVFKQIYSGQEIFNDQVVALKYSQCLEVYGNRQNPEVEFDGDPMGFLPCRIEMALDTLDLIGWGNDE